MKLVKMRYKTIKDEIKVHCYLLNISKKLVQESGIDDSKELIIIAKNKELIVREK